MVYDFVEIKTREQRSNFIPLMVNTHSDADP